MEGACARGPRFRFGWMRFGGRPCTGRRSSHYLHGNRGGLASRRLVAHTHRATCPCGSGAVERVVVVRVAQLQQQAEQGSLCLWGLVVRYPPSVSGAAARRMTRDVTLLRYEAGLPRSMGPLTNGAPITYRQQAAGSSPHAAGGRGESQPFGGQQHHRSRSSSGRNGHDRGIQHPYIVLCSSRHHQHHHQQQRQPWQTTRRSSSDGSCTVRFS